MGRPPRFLSPVLTVALLALGPLACGGGGGSSNANGLLVGAYHLVGISARTDPGPQVMTNWGTLSADGAGRLSLTAFQNEEGDTSGPDTQGNVPYGVSSDRTVTVLDAAEPSLAVAVGRITPQGDVVVLGSSADDRDPGMWIALRKAGSFSPIALAGRYHGCLIWHRDAPEDTVAYLGTWDFDALGGFTANGLSNVDGTTAVFSLLGSYSVDADGVASISYGVMDLSGGVLAGGRFAALAGSTFFGTQPALLVLIRATLVSETWVVPRGDSFVTGLERDVVGGVYRSYLGSFTVGSGTDISVSWRKNEEGAVSTITPWTSTWLGDPDAAFGFYDAEGDLYSGGADRDGRFAVMAGGRNAASNPALFFILR